MTDTSDPALDALVGEAMGALDNAMSVRDNEWYRVKLLQLCPDMIDDIAALRAERDKFEAAFWEAEGKLATMTAERDAQQAYKDAAYLERNKLVALLAAIFPAGTKRTAIEGWSDDWHGCVYIDFPWGQASWHYHDSQAHLFAHMPPYHGEWDGHTTDEKYAAIVEASRKRPASAIDHYMRQIGAAAYERGVHDAAAWLDCHRGPWIGSVAAQHIRALADAPPAPVVGVKPLVFDERRNNMWEAAFGYEIGYNGNDEWYRVKHHGRSICKKIGGFHRAVEWANSHHTARILAALMPQAERT